MVWCFIVTESVCVINTLPDLELMQGFSGLSEEDKNWILAKERSLCSIWILTTVEKKECENKLSHNSLWVPMYLWINVHHLLSGEKRYLPAGPRRCTSNGLKQDVSSAAVGRGHELPWLFSGGKWIRGCEFWSLTKNSGYIFNGARLKRFGISRQNVIHQYFINM